MNNNETLLSVILPVYNCEKYVAEAINSILNQTFINFELLISDDGSTDDTRSVISSFRDPRIIISHNSFNLGKTKTVNRLFNETNGEFVTIHDADDVSTPNRFETQLKEFEKNSSLAFCGTNFVTINTNGIELERSNLLTVNDKLKQNLFVESQFHGPTIIFRKKTALKLDEIFRPFFKDYNEDYDFSFRLSDFGEVTNCQEYLYMYRITPGSLSRQLTPQKRVSTKLVQKFATQRKQTGTDDLMSNRSDKASEELRELTRQYELDKGLLFREQAELDFYYGFYKSAFRNSLRAIKNGPLVFKNYRLVQHIVRKCLFGL